MSTLTASVFTHRYNMINQRVGTFRNRFLRKVRHRYGRICVSCTTHRRRMNRCPFLRPCPLRVMRSAKPTPWLSPTDLCCPRVFSGTSLCSDITRTTRGMETAPPRAYFPWNPCECFLCLPHARQARIIPVDLQDISVHLSVQWNTYHIHVPPFGTRANASKYIQSGYLRTYSQAFQSCQPFEILSPQNSGFPSEHLT